MYDPCRVDHANLPEIMPAEEQNVTLGRLKDYHSGCIGQCEAVYK